MDIDLFDHILEGSNRSKPLEPATTHNGQAEVPRAARVVFKTGAQIQGNLVAVLIKGQRAYQMLTPGRTTDARGQPLDVVAEYLFEADEIESVVLLHPEEPKSSIIS